MTARDYELICRAIALLSQPKHQQLSVASLARHLALSPSRCRRLRRCSGAVPALFRRWCGLRPQEFLEAITSHRAIAEPSAKPLVAAQLGAAAPLS